MAALLLETALRNPAADWRPLGLEGQVAIICGLALGLIGLIAIVSKSNKY